MSYYKLDVIPEIEQDNDLNLLKPPEITVNYNEVKMNNICKISTKYLKLSSPLAHG